MGVLKAPSDFTGTMSFWQFFQTASHASFHWLAVGFAVTALILSVWVPSARARLGVAVVLFALSFVGLVLAAVLLSRSADAGKSMAFLWLDWAALFFMSVAVINVVSVLLFDVVLASVHLTPPRIMRDLLIGIAYIVVAILLLSRQGVNVSGIIATSAVITAVLGFSLQDTLGNIMGGMALQMDRTITVGDWLRLPDQQEGQVVEMRWRQTSIQTRNWDTIVIPNSVLMKGQVTVLGRRLGAPRQERRWVYFNVDFRHLPTEVISIVETALNSVQIPHVATEPAPHCITTDFKESYTTYAARYWLTDLALTDPTDSIIRGRVFAALAREHITPSIPAQTLFIEADTGRRRKRKQDREIDRRMAALEHVEIFHMLTEKEQRELASRFVVAPFVDGEAIIKQGAEAHRLYIIAKGQAEVRISVDDGGLSQKVKDLGVNDFFGERGLLTGQPRAATVIACSDVVCYRLDKEAFEDVLHSRPEIAEDISHVLARRQVELEAIREGLNEEAARHRIDHHQRDILHRIIGFFRLPS